MLNALSYNYSFMDSFLKIPLTSYSTQYNKIEIFFLLVFVICNILIILAYVLSLTTIKDAEKLSEYECGFEPFDNATRHPFDVHFYIVGILFLIFDVEIALIFPWIIGLQTIMWFGFYSMMVFLIIITIGFFYEWHRGALSWPTQNTENNFKQRSNTNWLLVGSFLVDFEEMEARFEEFQILMARMVRAMFNDFDIDENLNLLSEQPINIVTEIFYFLPEIFLATAILIILIYIGRIYFEGHNVSELEKKKVSLSLINYSKFSIIITAVLTLFTLIYSPASPWKFSENFYINGYILVIKLILLLSGFFVLHHSRLYVALHFRLCYEYSVLILTTIMFLLFFVSSSNLISLFICLIGFSLSTYILIVYDAPLQPSIEAATKYFYLSALSSGLIACGFILIYLLLLQSNFNDIRFTMEILITENITTWAEFDLGVIAIFAIIYGFLFKLSAFPCHFWVSEIYEGSPSPVMALFILPIKIAVFATFINVFATVFKEAFMVWGYLIFFSSVMSMSWGCLAAFNENKIKKFIAYSSVNQMGFLLIGLAVNTFSSLSATVNYLFIYILMNWAFLTMYLSVYNSNKSNNIEFLTDLKYQKTSSFSVNMFSFFGIALILFSMAGIPPLAGFFGKLMLFLTAFTSEHYILILVGMFTSLISAYYYCRIINIIYFSSQSVLSPFTPILNLVYDKTSFKGWIVSLSLTVFYLFIFIPVLHISSWMINAIYG